MSSLPRELYKVYYDRKSLPVNNVDIAYTTIQSSNSNDTVRDVSLTPISLFFLNRIKYTSFNVFFLQQKIFARNVNSASLSVGKDGKAKFTVLFHQDNNSKKIFFPSYCSRFMKQDVKT